MTIQIEKEGKRVEVRLEDLEKWTGAKYLDHLQFDRFSVLKKISSFSKKATLNRQWAEEQLWLGKYFKEEILKPQIRNVYLKWIDEEVGWGVFALKDLQKMEFISCYTGVVRKYTKRDEMNSYCFEFHLLPQEKTPFTIDGREKGGIGRYLNHDANPNLVNVLATIDGMTHVIFYTSKVISKGEQLTFDYGPAYWKKRPPPRSFGFSF